MLLILALLACHTPAPVPDLVPVAVPSPAAPTAAAAPLGRGDACATDADCAWDSPCTPQRCGAAPNPPIPRDCDESWPAPGTCGCVEHQCTNHWFDPSKGASETGCASDGDCAIDVGTGTCHLHGNTHIGPITSEGPLCRCDAATTTCVPAWVAPVPCTSFQDCAFDKQPRLHPIAPTAPRARPVKMCVDGSVDAVCGKSGVCETIVAGC